MKIDTTSMLFLWSDTYDLWLRLLMTSNPMQIAINRTSRSLDCTNQVFVDITGLERRTNTWDRQSSDGAWHPNWTIWRQWFQQMIGPSEFSANAEAVSPSLVNFDAPNWTAEDEWNDFQSVAGVSGASVAGLHSWEERLECVLIWAFLSISLEMIKGLNGTIPDSRLRNLTFGEL